jgi:hypothetical protein
VLRNIAAAAAVRAWRFRELPFEQKEQQEQEQQQEEKVAKIILFYGFQKLH